MHADYIQAFGNALQFYGALLVLRAEHGAPLYVEQFHLGGDGARDGERTAREVHRKIAGCRGELDGDGGIAAIAAAWRVKNRFRIR